MKKKLVSLAIASALVMPVIAQANDAPVVYGQLNMIYGKFDNKTDGTVTTDNWQVKSYDSRLGFKGTRDFGDGLMGVYQIELGVNPDSDGKGTTPGNDGTAGLSRRNMFVGLKGGWGEFRVGRHDTPLKMAQGKFDQFGDTDADFKHAGSQDAEHRFDNMLLYLGKTGAIGYNIAVAPGEDAGTAGSSSDNGPADTVSVSLSYTSGPMYAAVAQDKYANAASAASDTMTRVVGTYNTGSMQLGLLYQSGVKAPAASSKEETWMGLSFGMNMGGNNKLKAQYVTTEDNATTKTEGTLTAIGFDHKFDKKTTGYVMYSATESKTGSSKTEGTVLGAGMLLKF